MDPNYTGKFTIITISAPFPQHNGCHLLGAAISTTHFLYYQLETKFDNRISDIHQSKSHMAL